MTNFSHRVSFHSLERIAPSNHGIKYLARLTAAGLFPFERLRTATVAGFDAVGVKLISSTSGGRAGMGKVAWMKHALDWQHAVMDHARRQTVTDEAV